MRVLYFHQHFSTPDGATGTRSYEVSKRLLASGHSVLIADQGELCRIDPDGSCTVLEQIEPPTRVQRGLKVTIR